MKKHRGVLVLLAAVAFIFAISVAGPAFAQKKFDENQEISTGRQEATGEKTPPMKGDKNRADKAKMEKAGKKYDANQEVSTGREDVTGEKAPVKKTPKKAKKAKAKPDTSQEVSTGREEVLPEKISPAAPVKK